MLPKEDRPAFRVKERAVEDISASSGMIQPERRRFGCSCGAVVLIIIVMFGFGAVMAVSTIGSMDLSQMWNGVMSAFNIPVPETIAVAGDAANFDAVQELDTARQLAGDDLILIGLRASYVRSDGTMDLTATYNPSPRAYYTFLRQVPRPDNAPPPGVGGAGVGDWYERLEVEAYRPGQASFVTQRSGASTLEYTYVNQGMLLDVADPQILADVEALPPPTCSFASLWQLALDRGFPADAVAVIEYNADGYTFSITGVGRLSFNMRCNLIS